MKYIEKNEDYENIYSVEYDEEKLRQILEKLKEYRYTAVECGEMAGNITRWPNNKKIIKRRVSSFFYSVNHKPNAKLYPESIVHHIEKDNDYVTFEFSYDKLPDLYDYVDLLVYSRDITNYSRLFKSVYDYNSNINFEENYDPITQGYNVNTFPTKERYYGSYKRGVQDNDIFNSKFYNKHKYLYDNFYD